MRFKGIENDCFLKLVASLKSGLNLSETRVLLAWFANALEYKITNQQIAVELSMKSSNVCRELASICDKEWLVGEEVRRNKWEQPVIMYYLHPKRLEQIQKMVVEYPSTTNKSSQKNSDSDIQVPMEDIESQSIFEKKFNEFVKKYNLKDRGARKDHGNDVCRHFFAEIKNQQFSLEDLNILKSKYIGLFCHKGKMISEEQYSEWKLQVANCWEKNLEVVLGAISFKALSYIPNNENISLIESVFTDNDYTNAFSCWNSKYPGAGFDDFKKFYIRDLDIEMQEGIAKDVLPPLPQFLGIKINFNKKYAKGDEKTTLSQESDHNFRVPQTGVDVNLNQKKTRDAIIDENGLIRTEHLVYDMPDEDDEGDPLYTPPEERINLKPEDCASMEYDEDFCARIGATKDRR